jgi:hypothetical protein
VIKDNIPSTRFINIFKLVTRLSDAAVPELAIQAICAAEVSQNASAAFTSQIRDDNHNKLSIPNQNNLCRAFFMIVFL